MLRMTQAGCVHCTDRMSAATIRTKARSWLPNGPRDFAFQTVLWLSFVFAYQVIQAGAGRDRSQALTNGLRVLGLERDLGHRLLELRIQEIALDSPALHLLTTLVYRTSEFVVIALALLWVYLRRNTAFRRLRNTLIVTSLLALVAFYAFPAAPPRTFAFLGFVDTVRGSSGTASSRGFELLPSDQYAAMPSLHSADALIIGVGLALLVRSPIAKLAWFAWPLVVWFSVLATANHFWLDVVAGIVLAGVGAFVVATAHGAHEALVPAPSPSMKERPDPALEDGASEPASSTFL